MQQRRQGITRAEPELLATGWASHAPISNEENDADGCYEPQRGSPAGWGRQSHSWKEARTSGIW